MHDHLLIPKQLYESMAQSRGILRYSNQPAADCHLRGEYCGLLVGNDISCNLSGMDYLYHCIGMLSILDIMHDNLEHSYRAKVRYHVNQSSYRVYVANNSL